MHQTPQFWRLTLQALEDSALLRLILLYDPAKGALSIYNFLQMIEHNINGSNSMALNVSSLDAKALQKEWKRLHETDPMVSVLLEIRDRYHIHREARLTSSGVFSSLPELSYKRIGHLLKRGRLIINKYRRLYGRLVLLERFVGSDDYQHTLDLIRQSLQAIKAKHQAERERYS